MLLQRVEIEPAGEPVDRPERRGIQVNRTDVS
jgi:hypothetical protein